MSAFRIGQKVVCIDGKPIGGHTGQKWPVAGKVYTVREIFFNPTYKTTQMYLVEVVNPVWAYRDRTCEGGFNVHRFRPLVTRDQSDDVALIKSLLAPVRRSASRPVSASASTEATATVTFPVSTGEGA